MTTLGSFFSLLSSFFEPYLESQVVEARPLAVEAPQSVASGLKLHSAINNATHCDIIRMVMSWHRKPMKEWQLR